MENTALSLITVRGQSIGLGELAKDVRDVEDAQKGVIRTSEQEEKRVLSSQRAWARLQSQYDATYRAQQELARVTKLLDSAQRQGLGTEEQRARIAALANERALKMVQANDNIAKSTRGASNQITQLGYQVQDVFAQLSTGTSPFVILAQQGGQVYSALSGPSGVVGGLKNVGGWLTSLLTPAKLLGVTLAGAATAAIVAWSRFDSMGRQTLATVTGMGRGLDTTAAQFQAMAARAAEAGGLSVKQASDIANVFGRVQQSINVDVIGRAVALSKDFAATYTNGDLQAGQAKMAQLMESGADGVARFARQQVNLNAQQRAALDDAVRRNDAASALNTLFDALNGKLAKYNETVGPIAQAWEKISRAVSDMVTKLGPLIDKIGSGAAGFISDVGTVVDKIANRSVGENVREVGGRALRALGSAGTDNAPRAISAQEEAINKLAAAYGRYGEAGKRANKESEDFYSTFNFGSKTVEEAIRKTNGDSVALQEQTKALEANENQRKATNNAAEQAIKQYAPEIGQLKDYAAAQDNVSKAIKDGAVSRSEGAVVTGRLAHAQSTYIDETQKAARTEALAVKSIMARTQSEKEEVAAQQARLSVAGQAISQAQEDVIVQGARLRIRAEYASRLRDMERDEDQELERLKLEKDLIFASNEERARQLAMLSKRQEFIRSGQNPDDPRARAVEIKAGEVAETNQELDKQQRLWSDVKNTASSALTGFVKDLQAGVKLGEALRNVMKRVADTMVQKGIEGAITNLAAGNYGQAAISGGIAAVGAVIGASGKSQARQQRIEQMKQAYIDQQEKANQAIIDAQNAAIEAADKAAAAIEKAANEAFERAEAVARRMETYADRQFRAGLRGDSLETQLAALRSQQQREREDEMRQGGEAINGLVAAQQAEELRLRQDYADQQSEIARQQAEQQAEEQQRQLKELQDFYAQQAKTIRDFIDSLQGGTGGGLSPMARLEAAQSAFNRQLALARTGDRDALSGITQYAQRLLEAGRDVYASGSGYQDIYQRVIAVLEALMGGSAIASGAGAATMGTAANSNTPASAGGTAGFSSMADVVGGLVRVEAAVNTLSTNATRTMADGFNAVVGAENQTRDAVKEGADSQAREIRLAAQAA